MALKWKRKQLIIIKLMVDLNRGHCPLKNNLGTKMCKMTQNFFSLFHLLETSTIRVVKIVHNHH